MEMNYAQAACFYVNLVNVDEHQNLSCAHMFLVFSPCIVARRFLVWLFRSLSLWIMDFQPVLVWIVER